jgi:hypothetical protein
MAKRKMKAPDWKSENAIQELVLRSIETDDANKGDERLVRFYERLSPVGRAAVDAFAIELCGWSMRTLAEAVRQRKLPEDVEDSGDNPFVLLDELDKPDEG